MYTSVYMMCYISNEFDSLTTYRRMLSRFDSMANLLDSISLTAIHVSTGGQSFKNLGLSSGIKENP